MMIFRNHNAQLAACHTVLACATAAAGGWIEAAVLTLVAGIHALTAHREHH